MCWLYFGSNNNALYFYIFQIIIGFILLTYLVFTLLKYYLIIIKQFNENRFLRNKANRLLLFPLIFILSFLWVYVTLILTVTNSKFQPIFGMIALYSTSFYGLFDTMAYGYIAMKQTYECYYPDAIEIINKSF